MEEIGNLFTLTRESAGVSLKEVSDDLGIEEAILENIEDGRSGAFANIFLLKDYVFNYAKYLGLDADKIIDEFNEYVFEATSKIPVKEIEKKVTELMKSEEEEEKDRIISPYTKKEKKNDSKLFITLYIIVITAFIISVFWCVKQIAFRDYKAINTVEVERSNFL